MKAGDLVVANIRLERLLSEGGMGSVWVAQHLTLSTEVAVKFMGADTTSDPDAIARFKREASAAAQIKSPHIVQMFDHGLTSDGVPYIVMELLHGEDLDHRLDRGSLSVGDTLVVVRHLCKALGRAHQQGIIHRDIKPANLFLVEADGDIFVKVLDFGIAKRTVAGGELTTEKTRSGTMVGTPAYMSPEQIMGTPPIDARADLWAAAVVAYACLTGTVPFDGDTIGALAVSINAAKFLPVTMRVPSLPGALDDWFARALARSPDARFLTAKELSDALTAAVPKEMRSVRPPESVAMSEHFVARSEARTVDIRSAGNLAQAPTAPAVVAATVVAPPSRIRALDALGEEPGAERSLAIPVAIGAAVLLAVGGVATFLARGGPTPPPASTESSVAAAVASEAPSASVGSAPPLPVAPAAAGGDVAADARPGDPGDASGAADPTSEAKGASTRPAGLVATTAQGRNPPPPDPRRTGGDGGSRRVPFGVLAVPELPQIATTPAAAPSAAHPPPGDAAAPRPAPRAP